LGKGKIYISLQIAGFIFGKGEKEVKMKNKNLLTEEDARKARWRLEEAIRHNINLLVQRGLVDEAEDLCFRLQKKMTEAMGRYLSS